MRNRRTLLPDEVPLVRRLLMIELRRAGLDDRLIGPQFRVGPRTVRHQAVKGYPADLDHELAAVRGVFLCDASGASEAMPPGHPGTRQADAEH